MQQEQQEQQDNEPFDSREAVGSECSACFDRLFRRAGRL